MTRPRLLTELAFWLSLAVVLALSVCATSYLVTCLLDWLL